MNISIGLSLILIYAIAFPTIHAIPRDAEGGQGAEKEDKQANLAEQDDREGSGKVNNAASADNGDEKEDGSGKTPGTTTAKVITTAKAITTTELVTSTTTSGKETSEASGNNQDDEQVKAALNSSSEDGELEGDEDDEVVNFESDSGSELESSEELESSGEEESSGQTGAVTGEFSKSSGNSESRLESSKELESSGEEELSGLTIEEFIKGTRSGFLTSSGNSTNNKTGNSTINELKGSNLGQSGDKALKDTQVGPSRLRMNRKIDEMEQSSEGQHGGVKKVITKMVEIISDETGTCGESVVKKMEEVICDLVDSIATKRRVSSRSRVPKEYSIRRIITTTTATTTTTTTTTTLTTLSTTTEDECKQVESKGLEIALIVDTSGSMNTPIGNWKRTKEWMKKLLDEFKIDGAKRKVGFIKWSSSVDHSYTVRFTDNLTAEQMKQKIDSLPLPMGGTDGGLALNEAFNTLFNGKGNPDVYQNAIFLSDGNGGDPLTAAENFHRNGIHLTSVALGAANKDLMRHLTGMNRNPPLTYKNHFFEHHDANMLAKAAKDMKNEILSCKDGLRCAIGYQQKTFN